MGVGGLSKKREREKIIMDIDYSVVIAGGRWGEGGGRRLDLGWWTHNTVYR